MLRYGKGRGGAGGKKKRSREMSTGRSREVSRRSKVEIKQFMLEAARTLTHSLTFIVNEVIPVN